MQLAYSPKGLVVYPYHVLETGGGNLDTVPREMGSEWESSEAKRGLHEVINSDD